jgi:hypothetical protein
VPWNACVGEPKCDMQKLALLLLLLLLLLGAVLLPTGLHICL